MRNKVLKFYGKDYKNINIIILNININVHKNANMKLTLGLLGVDHADNDYI